MRVITGLAKSRRLLTAPGDDIRPTTDRVKESVFAIIQFDIEGRKILELFAGSGQMGIEALSRGAAACTFVDNAAAAIVTVRKNLEITGLSHAAAVKKTDYKAFLQSGCGQFDIVFIDPPYSDGYADRVLKTVCSFDILSPNAIIVVETTRSEKLSEKYEQAVKGRDYLYGNTKITCYHNIARENNNDNGYNGIVM